MNRQMSSQQLRAKTGISPPPPPDHPLDSTSRIRRSKSSRGVSITNKGPKNQLLNKYRETEFDDNIFGEEEPLEAIDVDLDDEFKTLRLQDIQELQNHSESPQRYLLSPKKHLGPRVALQRQAANTNSMPVDTYDDEFELEDDLNQSPMKSRANRMEPEGILLLSPDKQSMVTSSPKSHRISLSEYSEEGEEDHNDTDTEVTSNLNEEDFEDIDNIFGDEESGIYSSAGKNRFQSILKTQQMKLQNDAEIEERELMKKYNRIKKRQQQDKHQGQDHEISTLKLKNLDPELDPFLTWKQEQAHLPNDNDQTINYEYTKDDFENFEDGFEMDEYPKKLQMKKSMPNVKFKSTNDFSNPYMANPPLKKFQSTYNLPSDRNLSPKFDNKVMRKLDRIPSFYNHQRLNDMIEQNEAFRMTKHQLLQQYQEIDKQHKQTNDRIVTMKKSMSVPGNYGQSKSNLKHSTSTKGRRQGKPIGLVRYLNEVPNTLNSNMKYNHTLKVWEGNDLELLKFNNNLKKPSLIKFQDYIKKYQTSDQKDDGDMVFDDKNMRWVSKTGAEEEDVFGDLKEEEPVDTRMRAPSSFKPPTITPSISNFNSRGVSNFTTRTTSTVNLNSRKSSKKVDSYETGNDFLISKKNIDRFLKEEAKIAKKTTNWFNQGEIYQITSYDNETNMDYYWDIRNLVIDNNGNESEANSPLSRYQ